MTETEVFLCLSSTHAGSRSFEAANMDFESPFISSYRAHREARSTPDKVWQETCEPTESP